MDKKQYDEFTRLLNRFSDLQHLKTAIRKPNDIKLIIDGQQFNLTDKQVDKLRKEISKELEIVRIQIRDYD